MPEAGAERRRAEAQGFNAHLDGSIPFCDLLKPLGMSDANMPGVDVMQNVAAPTGQGSLQHVG